METKDHTVKLVHQSMSSFPEIPFLITEQFGPQIGEKRVYFDSLAIDMTMMGLE